MIENYGCTGTLTITPVGVGEEDIVLNGPAWDIPDLTPLWIEAAQRGEDRLIPGAVGVLPYRRRLTVTEHSLGMWIIGDTLYDGTPAADSWIGLQTNIEFLRDNIVDPTNVGDGTRVATLTMPNGEALTANIHVTGMRIQGIDSDDHVFTSVNAALMISIPAGRFA